MKVLFAPFYAGGHTSAVLGLAEELLGRGHEVALLLAPIKAKRLDRKGFTIELLDTTGYPNTDETASLFFGSASLNETIGKLFHIRGLISSFLDTNRQIEKVIKKLKPDVIVVDTLYVPAITKSQIPWVSFCSPNPMAILTFRDLMSFSQDARGRKTSLELFWSIRDLGNKVFDKLYFGKLFWPKSRYLNLYMFPKEIDYDYVDTSLVNLLNLECSFNPETDKIKKLDENLMNFISKSNKLIMISLGTYVSADIKFMKNIVKMCSQSKHHFIVSKGVKHSEYELPLNMWGKEYIPQRQILPYVDLVISHGGNNTFTEAFYHGKPQIIILTPPLFDQMDNALRISQFNLGVYIKRNALTRENLLDSIDKLLGDKGINEKLSGISSRMQKENKLSKAAELIEKLVK